MATGADAVVPTSGLVVLAYHRVGTGGTTQMDLPLDRFRAQMAELADSYRVLSLNAALAEYSAGAPAEPEPCVVLTFDDGTADFADDVLAVLDEFDLPATVYVATEPVITGERWPDGAAPLSEAALTEVAGHPLVTVGCHGQVQGGLAAVHDPVVLGEEAAAAAVQRALDALHRHVGAGPRHRGHHGEHVDHAGGVQRATQARWRAGSS